MLVICPKLNRNRNTTPKQNTKQQVPSYIQVERLFLNPHVTAASFIHNMLTHRLLCKGAEFMLLGSSIRIQGSAKTKDKLLPFQENPTELFFPKKSQCFSTCQERSLPLQRLRPGKTKEQEGFPHPEPFPKRRFQWEWDEAPVYRCDPRVLTFIWILIVPDMLNPLKMFEMRLSTCICSVSYNSKDCRPEKLRTMLLPTPNPFGNGWH